MSFGDKRIDKAYDDWVTRSPPEYDEDEQLYLEREEEVQELFDALDKFLHGKDAFQCGYFINDSEMICPDCRQPHIGMIVTKKDGFCLNCVIKRALRMGLSAGRDNVQDK